jgi:hypothetical protein
MRPHLDVPLNPSRPERPDRAERILRMRSARDHWRTRRRNVRRALRS